MLPPSHEHSSLSDAQLSTRSCGPHACTPLDADACIPLDDAECAHGCGGCGGCGSCGDCPADDGACMRSRVTDVADDPIGRVPVAALGTFTFTEVLLGAALLGRRLEQYILCRSRMRSFFACASCFARATLSCSKDTSRTRAGGRRGLEVGRAGMGRAGMGRGGRGGQARGGGLTCSAELDSARYAASASRLCAFPRSASSSDCSVSSCVRSASTAARSSRSSSSRWSACTGAGCRWGF